MTDTYALEPIQPGTFGAKWSPIIEGALAGAYALPQSVVRAIVAYNRLHAAQRSVSAAIAERFPRGWLDHAADPVGRAAARRMILDGDPTTIPDLTKPIIEAEGIAHELELRRAALDAGADETERWLDSLVSEATILPVLREALTETYAAVRELPEDVPQTAEAALDAPAARVAAYRRLQAILTRHRMIRDAQRCLRGRIPSRDGRGLFLETPVAPTFKGIPTTSADIVPAGPRDELPRLYWLADEGSGWCPSAEEQGQAADAWIKMASGRLPGAVARVGSR